MKSNNFCLLIGLINLGITGGHDPKSFPVLKEPIELKHLRHSSRSPKVFSHPKVYRCDDHGKDLVVNFVNLNYPDNDSNRGDNCNFRLIITRPQICQIRVDFVDTEMMRPVKGDCIGQYFSVQGSVWPTGLPRLCGQLNDQHFYLHLEPWTTNATFVDFAVNTVAGGDAYRFGVWLTQIDCSSFNVLKAPDGCTQYFLGETGLVKSFNFEGSEYLNGQNFLICIRPAAGVCGIRYEAKTGEFGLRKNMDVGLDALMRSGTGSKVCGMDYLRIPDGMATLGTPRNGRIFFRRRPAPAAPAPAKVKKPEVVPNLDRFCGGRLSPINDDSTNQPIFARFFSNLITLQAVTSSTEAAKFMRLNGQNGTLLGYQLSYQQVRECGQNETDLVTQPRAPSLFVSSSKPQTPRPFGGTIFREELDTKVPGLETMFGVAVPDGIKRNSNESATFHEGDDENDSLWDYLDNNWETNGTDEGEFYQ